MNHNPPSDHDLQWQSFLYVAGEMSPEESLAFEERLADDQAAREAVARAVELTEVTALASKAECAGEVTRPSTISTPANPWARRLTWMSFGAAACLVGMLTILVASRAMRDDVDEGGLVHSSTGETKSLALAWASSRTDLSTNSINPVHETDSADDPQPLPVGLDNSLEPGVRMEGGGDDESSARDIETPSWMLMAVGGLYADSLPPATVPQ